MIDSVLALQLHNGRWLESDDPHPMGYLELDALYALKVMRDLVPAYRQDAIEQALDRLHRLGRVLLGRSRAELFALHPHRWLAAAGTLGLLQQHRPEQFPDDARWTDIFTDPRFYRSAAVETLA